MVTPVPLPDFALEVASPFVAASGLHVDDYDGSHVLGHVDLGPDHHTPWGVVHGGVHCSIIESAASIGGSVAVAPCGQVAVGVHNATDLLCSAAGGRAEVEATPVHQGRSQQIWQVHVRQNDTLLARGTVRLHNLDATRLPGGPPR